MISTKTSRQQFGLQVFATSLSCGILSVIDAITWGYFDQILEWFVSGAILGLTILWVPSIMTSKIIARTTSTQTSSFTRAVRWIALCALLITVIEVVILDWIDEFLDEMHFHEFTNPYFFIVFEYFRFGITLSFSTWVGIWALRRLCKVPDPTVNSAH